MHLRLRRMIVTLGPTDAANSPGRPPGLTRSIPQQESDVSAVQVKPGRLQRGPTQDPD
jgi:hypothetical protein